MWWCEMWVENKKADSRFIYIFKIFLVKGDGDEFSEGETRETDWKRDVGTFIFRKEQNNRS